MRSLLRSSLLALPALSLILASCGQQRVPIGVVELLEQRTTPVEGLEVFLDRGSVSIVRAESNTLHIEAEVRVVERRVAEFTGKDLLFEDHVAVDETDGVLKLQSAHDGDADGDDWELRLTVHLPSDPQIRVKLDAGSLSVRMPAAKGLSANVDAGQVLADIGRVEGAVEVRVDAGQIRFAAREAVGAVSLEVDAGQIDLTLPQAFAGSIDAETDVGQVDLAARFGLDTERDVTSQSAKGSVGEGSGAKVVIRVDAGQIKIH